MPDSTEPRASALRAQLMPYPAPPRPERKRLITTFYSFKGGVGRSMALQGVACALAQRRQSVLMVDGDLEAPGLTFAHLVGKARERYGFADLLGDLSAMVLRHPADLETIDQSLAGLQRRVQDALFELSPEHEQAALALDAVPAGDGSEDGPAPEALEARLQAIAETEGFELPPPGVVELFGAGSVVSEYLATLSRTDFDAIYDRDRPAPTEAMLEASGLNRRWERDPMVADVFAALVRQLLLAAVTHAGRPFDHVFIDSRTGLADTAGFCTRWLADRLVMLSGLNEQNIEGTAHVMQQLDLRDGNERLLTVVASPVPNSDLELVEQRLSRLRQRLGLRADPPKLHYEPILSLLDQPLREKWHRHSQLQRDHLDLARLVDDPSGREPDATAQWMLATVQREPTAEDLRSVAAELARLALVEPEGARGRARVLIRAAEANDASLSACVPLLRVAAALLPGELEARGLLAGALSDLALETLGQGLSEEGEALQREALAEFAAAEALPGSRGSLLCNWGTTLGRWAKAVAGSDPVRALELWQEACQRYAQAVELKPDMHEALSNWGATLGDWAGAVAESHPARAQELLREACQKYAQAVGIRPDQHEALYNWGVALAGWAEAVAESDPALAKGLWQEACQRYAEAVEIEPDKHEALNNWGVALSRLADEAARSDAEGARELWREACQRYARAVELEPSSHQALYNWGFAFSRLAQTVAESDPSRGREFWEGACQRYAQAVEIKPDKHEALHNWGFALSYLAETVAESDPSRARELWQEACRRYSQAVEIKPDDQDALYNWGLALYHWGQAVAASDRDRALELWEEACRRCAEAVELKPDMHEALNNWSAALMGLWRLTDDASLLAQAREKAAEAVRIQPGAGLYNVACMDALSGDAEAALTGLAEALGKGYIAWAHVAGDADWNGYRSDPRYLELEHKYGGGTADEGE